jgi:hypothetical protein
LPVRNKTPDDFPGDLNATTGTEELLRDSSSLSQLEGYFTFIPKAVLEYVWKLVFVVADVVVFATVASEG